MNQEERLVLYNLANAFEKHLKSSARDRWTEVRMPEEVLAARALIGNTSDIETELRRQVFMQELRDLKQRHRFDLVVTDGLDLVALPMPEPVRVAIAERPELPAQPYSESHGDNTDQPVGHPNDDPDPLF